VNITPSFLGRGSWLAKRDPRVPILVAILFILAMIPAWDGRLVLGLLVAALLYYRSAGIPFARVRRNWTVALTLITIVVIVNSVLTGDRVRGMETIHTYFFIPVLGTAVSAESITYAVTQWLRYVAMITVGFPMAFCIAPNDLGTAFARLGLPEKLAFGLDLTFRFLPSLAVDYHQTIDAQRVRGYEPGGGRGGPINRLRRMVPILTPLTMNAISGAEDTIDAMDLRAFGTGRRSWLRELRYDANDRLLLLAFAALLFAFTVLGFAGITSELYVFPFLLDAAGA
jgi:energy-coupling factor transport system permease protein